MQYIYKNKKTGEMLTLDDYQNKYQMGFGQRELWDIIKKEAITVEQYTMNVNHPQYNDLVHNSCDIVFDE